MSPRAFQAVAVLRDAVLRTAPQDKDWADRCGIHKGQESESGGSSVVSNTLIAISTK
jgi:hypothetical protein